MPVVLTHLIDARTFCFKSLSVSLSPSTHDVLCPTCARPVPSLLLDATVQTPSYSVATHDASTQLPLTEFFNGCILSNYPVDRQALPSAHCNAGSASPPQPADIATLCSPSSASHACDGHEHTTAPTCLTTATTGSGEVRPSIRLIWCTC